MTDWWKTRCPNGHVDVRKRSSGIQSETTARASRYLCCTCGETFDELEPAPSPDEPAWKGEVVMK